MSDQPPAAASSPGPVEVEPATDHGPPPHPAASLAGGFLMGSADIVPGVSGGTIALVLGIYERLVAQVRLGAGTLGRLGRGDVAGGAGRARAVQWRFVLPLGAGILLAIGLLSSVLEHLLDEQPILLSGLFLGLVAGSVVVAFREFQHPPDTADVVVLVVTAVAVFGLLGLRAGRVQDPSLVVFALGGAVAICAMILPGISGSFILLLLGLYNAVIDSVDRLLDVVLDVLRGDALPSQVISRDLLVIGVVVLGAVVGLALFSTLLDWLLEHHHDVVLASLIGLMAGSLRVLWPWPAGADGVGDTALGAPSGQVWPTVGLAVVGLVAVLVIAALGDRYTRE